MIDIKITKNNAGQTVGFVVKNHGDSHVCAAVSMLVINTVNSIESLTQKGTSGFKCDYNENGGFIAFSLTDQLNRDAEAGLLLDALVLGLCSVRDQHPDEISIKLAKVEGSDSP